MGPLRNIKMLFPSPGLLHPETQRIHKIKTNFSTEREKEPIIESKKEREKEREKMSNKKLDDK